MPASKTVEVTTEEAAKEEEHVVYQWFWAGTHGETKTLTPDVKYTVKRHIVATRMIPIEVFPTQKQQKDKDKKSKGKDAARDPERGNDETTKAPTTTTKDDDSTKEKRDDDAEAKAASPKPPTLEDLLTFSFRVQVGRPTPFLFKVGISIREPAS
jgi:hypothetical protein